MEYKPISQNILIPDVINSNLPVYDKMQESIKKLQDAIQVKLQTALHNRLVELGINIDYEKEKTRRFKKLHKERSGNEETIYYNNGSENGLRVITFIQGYPEITEGDNSIKIEMRYY